MGKNSKNLQQEYIDDEDFSSEDMSTYRPQKNTTEELEVDEEVYKMLEYIELEWPSLSIDSYQSKVIVGTTPQQDEGKPELISIEIEDTDFNKLNYQNLFISHPPNKLRVFKNYVFAISDRCIIRYSLNDKNIVEAKGNYGFGLFVNENSVIVGSMDGFVEVYDHNLHLKYKFQASQMSIECVGAYKDTIITGSTDHCLKIFTSKGVEIYCIENDSDINCLEVRNGILIFGDDNGKIHKVDLETKEKVIFEWHQTPITFVRWRDDDTFVTGSEEQICIWDLSLQVIDQEENQNDEENIKNSDTESAVSSIRGEDFPKNLLFVHQGQKNYKDCCFNRNMVITTSEEGICIFEPVSFTTELN